MNTKGKQQLDKRNCASKYPKSTTGQVPAVLLVAKEAWCEGRINDNVEAIKHNSSENIDIGKHTVWSANIGCIGALWQETLSGHLQLHFLVLFTPLCLPLLEQVCQDLTSIEMLGVKKEPGSFEPWTVMGVLKLSAVQELCRKIVIPSKT